MDRMRGAYLGPSFSSDEISAALDQLGAEYHVYRDEDLFSLLAELLDQGKVLGWFQGRMEFGPRALGARSIIGDPRKTDMQSVMNLKIKYRESFRPFAPAVLNERVADYFDQTTESPYMLLVANVQNDRRKIVEPSDGTLFGIEQLKQIRSEIPAVTHVDYSARLQTVHRDTNPRFHALLEAFDAKTGCPVVVNTSFNVRGEPIVCSPTDAYRCFMRTEMDCLVVENYLLLKKEQPQWTEQGDWRHEFELD